VKGEKKSPEKKTQKTLHFQSAARF